MPFKKYPAFLGSIAVGWTLPFLNASAFADPGDSGLSAERSESRITVRIGNDLFTQYRFDPAQKYPYFFPIIGPRSGQSLTTESDQPYPHHHSLFFACDKVNDGNYWQDTNAHGQIVSKNVEVLQSRGKSMVIRDHCRWIRPDRPPVFDDMRVYTISVPNGDTRWIDVDVTLAALVDVHVQKTNHSLFSARVVKPLSVTGGGQLINANGQRGESETFGQKARWCDMTGTLSGHTEGLAILVHPQNRWTPSQWFTRDYGFMSPTPMNWLNGDGWHLPKGESIHFRYRVVVHAGSAQAAPVDAIFNEWAPPQRKGVSD